MDRAAAWASRAHISDTRPSRDTRYLRRINPPETDTRINTPDTKQYHQYIQLHIMYQPVLAPLYKGAIVQRCNTLP